VASSFTKKTLELYPNKLADISVIPYGFPEVYQQREYTSIRNRKLKLLFVGGLSQRKGIANVLEAVASLKNDVELTIIGNKTAEDCVPLNEGLRKHRWIASLPHSEILKAMREHDVLLFPSLFEGFGLVITESMSQGTPVVTTDRTIGGDIIKHGKNGWLGEPGDTNGLTTTIRNILNEPDVLIEISKAAVDTAGKRSWLNYSTDLANAIIGLK
jgi:glycosyltransferase involved in cell wall biosynthesis